jgi:hypothetical protein
MVQDPSVAMSPALPRAKVNRVSWHHDVSKCDVEVMIVLGHAGAS